MDAIGIAARAIKSGEASLMIAGGVESMSRAPFVMAKADERVLARGEDRGHDHRLALRQSADEGAVRRRLDARDGGERRARSSRSVAPTRTRSRCAASSAPPPRSPQAGFAEEIVPVTIPQKKGDPVVVEQGRASARDDARGAGQAEGRRAARRHRDRGQRVGRQRRRLRAAPRIGSGGEAARPDAARARRRHGRRPAWRRASWASGRRRRCARCSRRPARRSATWTSSS